MRDYILVDWCDNMHSLLHIGRMYNSEVKKVFSAVHIYVHVYPKLLRFLRDRNIPLLYAPVTLNRPAQCMQSRTEGAYAMQHAITALDKTILAN